MPLDVLLWEKQSQEEWNVCMLRMECMQVCALLGGGGYAEKVNVPAGQLLPIPKGVSLRDAAGIPEVACTVWSTIFMTVHLTKGESLLVPKKNPPFN